MFTIKIFWLIKEHPFDFNEISCPDLKASWNLHRYFRVQISSTQSVKALSI